ncbi:hypothetical protein AB0A63_36210 [Lentzea sp. NPDC042327]|uniref:hypothetical protein n=1 Tax=Lentzea sp. NPDC042327 TaxID=3154801 RepID=UPI00340DEAF6
MWHGFLDESRRGTTYLVAVTLVRSRDLDSMRSVMRGLVKQGQRRVHFNIEGDRRRKDVLTKISALGVRAHLWTCKHNNDSKARSACLFDMVPRLVDLDVSRLVLESCQHQDAADRKVLAAGARKFGASFTYEHLRPAEDPLLWISDAVAWSYGAGGDWRRRVADLVDGVCAVNVP